MEIGKPAYPQVRTRTPDSNWAYVRHNIAVRAGLFTGVALSVAFTAWLLVANRLPQSEHSALQRNLVAACVLGLIAAVPVLKFLRSPGNLLSAGLVGWSFFALFYRGLCVHFRALSERFGALEVFMMGALVYMILATLSWLGTCIWRARASHVSHAKHHHAA